MLTCPSCGQENPAGFRLCGMCGARMHDAPAPREERKVVTVLFCDLVGSTAQAERMDPEDVRALLSRYHERVRADLERFGGTVEKFIGDAVMALFGAPTAHEDDPERAVRAALAIREWAQEEGEPQVRIGITTGEVLVALSADPRAGEGMASGAVVNTAARLESGAPVNGILVDATTHRATARAIEYGEPRAIAAKGKTEAVSVCEVLHARARVQVERGGRAPLVGREKELEVLLAALRRARDGREPQLLTLVGVPGIGKSRLVYELYKAIEVGGELTFWRQGRSLPYGNGVSYWALGEMVKAQAGVLDTDDAARTGEKLRDAVAAVIPDAADAQWVERHLRPLVGLEADEELGADRRNEAFAAWRRFLEALAEHRPLVLVFEDLHFADDGLLDFVDYLADWASGVAILVVGTARPELLARRPGWGGGKANAATLSLAALSDEEIARLVHALLERPALPAELQQTLLARAGGNPLYAEEFVRMAEEREPGEELPLPETVQALIAARIDALLAQEKVLLQDASVLGKVFWLGAAAALSQVERRAAEECLHALERKEFIRRERHSSVAGEIEYAFRHLLVRDVAYGQIPRAARAETHRRAAAWIESLGRSDDHAEMVAHHYLSALELLLAAGRPTADIAGAARLALREAGERAFALNAFPPAATYYGEAFELWPDDDPERGELLFSLARARHRASDALAEQTLEQAREALLANGRRERAAEAEALLAELCWDRADRERCDAHLDRAGELVRDLSASPGKAHVLSQIARFRMLARDYESAVAIGTQALAIAESLGLDELQAHALNNVASAKNLLGDTTAIADLERSVELALAVRSPEAARALNNLGSAVVARGDLRRGTHFFAEAARVGEELGATATARFARASYIACLQRCGEWDEALRHLNEHIAASAAGATVTGTTTYRERARIRFARNDVEGGLEDIHRALRLARQVRDPQSLVPVLGVAARLLVAAGRSDEARALGRELLRTPRIVGEFRVIEFAFVADRLGFGSEVKELLEQIRPQSPWTRAGIALVDGEYAAAADTFYEIGDLECEAEARLHAGETLVAEGRRAEADGQLAKALAFFRPVGATRYVKEAEALLSAPEERTSVSQ